MPMNLGLGLGLSRIRGGNSVPGLTIDGFSAAFAYSLRRIRTAYTGPLVRVRRSSDNTEQDIGYNGSNELDTTALSAFVGANSAFVVTWYDQSGNGRHMTQATTTAQPRIVNAGTIELRGTKPTMFFDGTDDFLSNSAPTLYAANGATFLSVYTASSLPAAPRLYAEGSSTSANPAYILCNQMQEDAGNRNDIANFIRNDANTIILAGTVAASNSSTILNASNLSADVLASTIMVDTGNGITGYDSGTIGTPRGYTRSGALTLDRAAIGTYFRNGSGTGFLEGRVSEVIGIPSVLTTANLQTIANDQGAYYGISIAPFDPVPLFGVAGLLQINGTGDSGSSLAVNLGGGPDSFDPIYLDRARGARRFVNGSTGNFDEVPDANLTPERWLASLPAGQTGIRFFFSSYNRNDPAKVTQGPDYSGRFRFRILQGAASSVGFSAAGTNVTQINSTTWEFDCDWAGDKWIDITPTAFPLHVSLVKTSDIAAVDAGAVFTEDYKNQFVPNSTVRLLNMFQTNVPASGLTALNDRTNWSNWPQLNWQNGRPLAPMVAIFNEKMTSPWFCVHHNANDDHITQLATYLRDNLNPALKIRFELSNEIWNTSTFRQGLHFKALAESVWGVPNGYADSLWLHYAGKRFVQMMNIINGVFAGQTNRVIGVIAGQAAGSLATNTAMLDALSWKTYEPGSYVRPYTRAKEFSIAPYINYTHDKFTTAANNEAAAIKTQLDISVAAAANYIRTNLIPPGLANAKAQIDAAVNLAANRGLRLTIYEYNQHFDLYHFEGSVLYTGVVPVPGAVDAFREANHSQQMADAQDELRDYAKSRGVSVMAFFQDLGISTQFGSWGAKGHHQHNSVIWNDLLAWHTANPRWWAQ